MEDNDHIKLDNIERDLDVCFTLRHAVFEAHIGNTPNDPQNYLKHLTSQVSCIHWMLIPEAQISLRFALRPAIFKVQDVKNRKFTQWLQKDLKHLSIKSTLCTLNTHPRGPNFNPFRFTNSHFWDTGLLKSECTEWPQNDLNHWSVKSNLCTLDSHPRGPNFTPFRSTTGRFEFRDRFFENRKCTVWPQNDLKASFFIFRFTSRPTCNCLKPNKSIMRVFRFFLIPKADVYVSEKKKKIIESYLFFPDAENLIHEKNSQTACGCQSTQNKPIYSA